MGNVKQVIVIRKELKMRRGKEISSGSHASVAFLTRRIDSTTPNLKLTKEMVQWCQEGQTKITTRVNSEEELLEVFNRAKEKGLEAHLIKDAGKTEFGGVPTLTALAIGPNYASEIDKVTGNLKLY